MARRFTRRVRVIENYAAELVNADYSGVLAAEGDDELGSVARSLRTMAEHFRRMLARLAQESSLREAILGGMVEGVLAVESDLRITFYNQAFARAVHARTPTPDGLSMLQVIRDPALRELLSRVIATRAPVRERMSLLHAEGRIFEVQAAPLAAQEPAALPAPSPPSTTSPNSNAWNAFARISWPTSRMSFGLLSPPFTATQKLCWMARSKSPETTGNF